MTSSIAGEEFLKSGDISLIAILGPKRVPTYPEVPTVAETPGLKPGGKNFLEIINIIIEGGRMIMAPPGVPEEKRLFLEKALSASLKEQAVIDWAQKSEITISPLSGKECKELMVKLMEIVPKSERPKIKYIATQKYF